MPKVYIVNNTNHNYSKAERYGELVDVTSGKVPIFRTTAMERAIEEALESFTTKDLLLISGPTILNILAINVLFRKYSVVKVLIFDAKQQDYVVRHLYK